MPVRDPDVKGSGIMEGVAVAVAVEEAVVVLAVATGSMALAVMLLTRVRDTDRGTEDWAKSLSVIHLLIESREIIEEKG